MLYFVYKVVEVIYMNKDTVYCINRDISEEEAILSLAEGWSTANPPSQDQLDRSYYKKAFESIKQGKIKWNWAAAVFGPFWFLYHKMYLYFFILILTTLGLSHIAAFQYDSLLSAPLGIIDALLMDFEYNNILLFHGIMYALLIGFKGNNILLFHVKSRIKNNYHIWKDYNGTTSIPALVPFLTFMSWPLYPFVSHLIPLEVAEIVLSEFVLCTTSLFIILTRDRYYLTKALKELNSF